jgi:hypothetical protein
MTTGSTTQGFQFRITGVTGNSFMTRTKQNVRKRIESILYLETPPADAIKLGYVGSKELSPTNNLFIGDRSDNLFDNSRTGTIQEFIGIDQSSVTVSNKNFITTQIFNEAESGNIPLYYKHVISNPTSLIAESVRVYDSSFNPVSTDKFKLSLVVEYDDDTGLPTTTPIEYHLYNNLESFFNQDTGEYEVYFIQYTEVISGAEYTRTKLLNNELIYQEATVYDIWWITGDLKPWAQAYIIDVNSISLPANTDFAIKYQEQNRIRVTYPTALNDTDPWFPRVVNGEFTTGYGEYSLKYHIPEFENQAFNPIEPYKTAVNIRCSKIDTHLVKLPHGNIQSGALFSSLYVTAQLDGITQYAVTNDPFVDGDEYRDLDNQRVYNSDGDLVTWSYSGLLGLDSLSGIVHVSFDISDNYEVYAAYSYSEEHFELTGLNMNPIFDQTVHNELRAVYIVPESSANSNLGLQTESVRWVKVSPSGVINSTNQDNVTGGNEKLNIDVSLDSSDGYRINGVIGLYYNWRASTTSPSLQEVLPNGTLSVSSTSNFPPNGWIRFVDFGYGYMRYAKYTSITDTTFTLADSDEIPTASGGLFINVDTTIELVNFVDERTTLSTRLPDNETSVAPPVEDFIPTSFSRYFMLAELCINPSHSNKELVFIDIREDGGGIDPDKYEEAKTKQPRVQWFNDFGDSRGQIYPGNATMVVKLHSNMLTKFTEQEIEQIVDQNMPLGVKPLIRYYGYEPNITLVYPDPVPYTVETGYEIPIYMKSYSARITVPVFQSYLNGLSQGDDVIYSDLKALMDAELGGYDSNLLIGLESDFSDVYNADIIMSSNETAVFGGADEIGLG